MTSLYTIDPTRKYEIAGQVSPLKTAVFQLDAGANQQVVAAVSGKKLGIMGWKISANTSTQGQFNFLDGSGGGSLFPNFFFPGNNQPMDNLLIADVVYTSTTVSVGIYVTVTTAAVKGALFYIEYTP